MGKLALAVGLLLVSSVAVHAQDQGDAAKGLEFVRKNCTPCHSVEKGEQARSVHTAPSFQAVSDTPGMTSLALTAWFLTPHPTMPNLVIATRDVRDINAYILSLKSERQ